MTEINYSDLVVGPGGHGVPFVDGGRDIAVGLDCKSIALLAMRRAGKNIPELPMLGACDTEGEEAAEYLDGYLKSGGEHWSEVPKASQLGDLILSEGDSGPHASVLVSEAPARAITATVENGVVVVPLYSIHHVTRILRWTE